MPQEAPPASGLTAEAADHLRDAIRDGRFGPGDRIVERPVAEELGVSPITVRDAFARLEREGWILRRLPPAMGRAARHGDLVELLALDDAFHAALWRLAASPTLEELLRNLRARVTPLVRLSLQSMSSDELLAMEPWHAELLAALHAGAEPAREAARRHSDLTRDRVHSHAARHLLPS